MPQTGLPSPQAMAQAKVSIALEPQAAMVMVGKPFDGTVTMAEQISALALTLADMKPLTSEQLEKKLTVQMVLLEGIFTSLLLDANAAEDPESRLTFLNLALKVSDRSRAAALSIDAIHNPKKPTQFIKNYVDRQLNQLTAQLDPLNLEGDRPYDTAGIREGKDLNGKDLSGKDLIDPREVRRTTLANADSETLAEGHRP